MAFGKKAETGIIEIKAPNFRLMSVPLIGTAPYVSNNMGDASKEAMKKGEADQFAAKQVTMANEVKGQRRISQKEFEARTPYAEAYAKLAADLLGGGR